VDEIAADSVDAERVHTRRNAFLAAGVAAAGLAAIAMTSLGSIWQFLGPSGQYIYLQADVAGGTAQVLVG
jgi:hypothetical protein